MEKNRRPILIYDGDCGFCTRSAELIARHVPTRAELVPYQLADLDALRIGRRRAEREVLWVDSDGRVEGGARGVARLLIEADGGWAVLGTVLRAPVLRWLAAASYALVSRNRHRLPGATPACQRPPDQLPQPRTRRS